MPLAESQASNRSASGWVRRSFLVRFLYAFKALSKISWKLDDDVGVGLARDIRGKRGIGERRVESWVMGKEKSDTPHKRAGNVHGAIMDRRTRHMTTGRRGLGRLRDDTKKVFI
jgi:hypothetical protein